MKITNFFVLFTFFILTACGGDESSITPEATLTGTWELQEFTAGVETNTVFDETTTEAIVDIEGKNLDYRLTFSETAYSTEGSYGYEGNMEVDGAKSSFDESISGVMGNGTYTLVDDELISEGAFFNFDFQGMNFDIGQGEVKARITKLSNTELIISQDEENIIEQEQGGITFSVTNKTVSTSVWRKQ